VNNANALPLTVQELVCVEDVDQFAREVTSDLEALVQDIFHMLREKRGSNLDLPDRGIDIDSQLSAPTTNLRTIAGSIDHQLVLDPRVDASSTTITQQSDGSYLIALRVQVGTTVLGAAFSFGAGAGISLVSWGPQP
jgi:phage baseplate assembly protein W